MAGLAGRDGWDPPAGLVRRMEREHREGVGQPEQLERSYVSHRARQVLAKAHVASGGRSRSCNARHGRAGRFQLVTSVFGGIAGSWSAYRGEGAS
jgi:hypothetical protein